jgi:hypothetical protein
VTTLAASDYFSTWEQVHAELDALHASGVIYPMGLPRDTGPGPDSDPED